MLDRIEILAGRLDIATVVAFVTDPRAGGIDVFLGTTRGEDSPDGRELVALDYEAYEEMAVQQMRELAKRGREKWAIIKLAILHRVGRVALGEPSVIIAVSTPHRAAAFEACKFLIDSLKSDVAIWKKEIWADGSGTWVHPEEGARGEGQGASGKS
jgi:molybdopterin synthase catalytic subunit